MNETRCRFSQRVDNYIKRLTILGLILAFAGCSRENSFPRTSLYQVNADGSNLTLVLASPEKGYWGPAWSPDGKYLVVTVGTPGSKRGELYIANPDGSGLRQLTNNGRNNYLPAWSPNGQIISFISQVGDDTKTAEIYRIRLDGSHESRLTNNEAWEYGTSWSPDGTKIVFGSERGGEWQIYTMQPDGSDQLPLPIPAQGNAPVWSPDGEKIAFTSNRDGDDEIWVVNPDGSDQRNLTNNTAWDDNPEWSPDGSRIAFSSDRDGIANLFVMNADGTDARNLVKGAGLKTSVFSWSPAGNRLIFHAEPASK